MTIEQVNQIIQLIHTQSELSIELMQQGKLLLAEANLKKLNILAVQILKFALDNQITCNELELAMLSLSSASDVLCILKLNKQTIN